jgi:ubiquinone/menaquinone biosynthesis C-methylase UbiE
MSKTTGQNGNPSILREPFLLGTAEDNDLETNERRLTVLERALQKVGVNLSTHPRVLEIGCGSGRFLEFLASKGINIFGVEARLRGEGCYNTVAARIEQMPFLDSTFDVVLSSVVFDLGAYRQSHRSMLQEIARVLTPTGVYVSRGDEIRARVKNLIRVRRMRYDIPVSVYQKVC